MFKHNKKYNRTDLLSTRLAFPIRNITDCGSGTVTRAKFDNEIPDLGQVKDEICKAMPSGGYTTVQEEGVDLPSRTKINFIGPNITATDNGSETVVTVTSPSGSAPTFTGTLYVSKNGSDGTGVRNDMSKPFLTIAAAQVAALAGDLIYIYPGTYNESNLGKHDTNYYFERGAILSGAWLFKSFQVGMKFSVFGQGEFLSTFGIVVHLTHADSNVVFHGYSITSTPDSVTFRTDGANSKLTVKIITDIILASTEYVIVNTTTGCSVQIEARKISTTSGFYFSGTGASIDIVFKAERFEVVAGALYYCALDMRTGNVTMIGDIFVTVNNNYGISDFWLRLTQASLKIYGNITSSNVSGVLSMTGSNTYCEFHGIVTATGTGTGAYNATGVATPIGIANGKFVAYDNLISSRADGQVLAHHGGKTVVHSLVKNLTDLATAYGVLVTGAGLILKQDASIFVTNAATDSVYAGAAQTIKTYPGAVSNKAVNVNITEQVSTILVDANVDAE